ncbi:MAG TPA: BNR-4 repeat-containing protein [Candidatus Limnocylindrales bacterium]|nr:BNR-4 repeat-containing protein [Candidatus Limnocylindrales bacterium]
MRAIPQRARAYGFSKPAVVNPLAPFQVIADGNGTIGSGPSVVYRNGATYFGWVNSSGDVGITKYVHATQALTSFTLAAAFEVNGHDNATISILPDGRIMCLYCKHNDTGEMRMRISTSAYDISAWSPQTTVDVLNSGGGMAYNLTFQLSVTGKTYMLYRAGSWAQRMRATVDGSTWDTDRVVISNGSQRPYPQVYSDGVSRVDFVFSTGNPAQVANSLYHGYMISDAGGTETYYKSDGTLIGAAPLTPANATLVYDGTSQDGWAWDIATGPDGHPWVLWVKYVTPGTDHRHMFSRWTGLAWVHTEITPSGGSIDTQTYSDGQACFDGNDPTKAYLSKRVGSWNEIQLWETSDSGATWSKTADITSGSSVHAFTPRSPEGHAGDLTVSWYSGTQVDYLDYDTAIRAAGA